MMEWTDKENHIAVIALDKCRIGRAHIFELLTLLKIMHVSVYRTVKLLFCYFDILGFLYLTNFAW